MAHPSLPFLSSIVFGSYLVYPSSATGKEDQDAKSFILGVKQDRVTARGDAVIAVEGKVDEPFGDLVSTWNDHSSGKERRLEALCASLGLRVADLGGIRYQLLHRTASAIYEAQRYRTTRAVMLVGRRTPKLPANKKKDPRYARDIPRYAGI